MSLRRAVQALSGQDVRVCQACLDCDVEIRDEMDIPLSSIVQLILEGDEEVLHCRTVWSDAALEAARGACRRGLDLCAIMLALRQLAARRLDDAMPR
jgi:hypothetical protein